MYASSRLSAQTKSKGSSQKTSIVNDEYSEAVDDMVDEAMEKHSEKLEKVMVNDPNEKMKSFQIKSDSGISDNYSVQEESL